MVKTIEQEATEEADDDGWDTDALSNIPGQAATISEEGDEEEEGKEEEGKGEEGKDEVSEQLTYEDIFLDMCNAAVASAGSFHGKNVVNGEADILLGSSYKNIGWVPSNVPVMLSVCTYNAPTQTNITSFHKDRNNDLQRIAVHSADGKENDTLEMKTALFQSVVNRTSGVPSVF